MERKLKERMNNKIKVRDRGKRETEDWIRMNKKEHKEHYCSFIVIR